MEDARPQLHMVKLSRAVEMLAECKTLPEVKEVINLAAAAEAYAKTAKLGLEAQNHAAEIKIRAEVKAAGFMAQLERGKPAPGTASIGGHGSEYRKALDGAGATRQEAHRWSELAAVPEEKRQAWIETAKAAGKEVTSGAIRRELGREVKRQERLENLAEIATGNAPLTGELGTFPVIYADPPWRYEHCESESREIENQYPTMDLGDICILPVADHCTDDAVLFLWATAPKLAEAMRVVESWGFVYRTCMVWDKEKIGMGYWARQQHELLLIATRGQPPAPAPANRPASVVRSPRGQHSAKPEVFYGIIEAMFPTLPKLEMFCRSPRENWSVWGNQAA